MAKGKFVCDTPGCEKTFKTNRALGIHKSYEDRIARGEAITVFGKKYSRQGTAPGNTDVHQPVEHHVKVPPQQPSQQGSLTSSSSSSSAQEVELGAGAPGPEDAGQQFDSHEVSSSNYPATDAEIPESIINQMTDPAVQQRMRDINARAASRRNERPAQPPAVVVQNYGGQGQGPQDGNVPPAPQEPGIADWIRGLAEEGYKFFRNYNAQKAAALAPKEPSLAEIVGNRAIFRFIDGLSTAQGKATGNKLGKADRAVEEEGDAMDGLVTRQELTDALTRYKPSAALAADEHVPV